MHVAVGLLLALVTAAAPQGAAPPKRHGVEADLKAYPQGEPREALASVLKAVENKRVDYLLAHLADPDFVDRRVKDNGGKLDELLKETTAKLLGDPGAAKQLARFLKEGEWQTTETTACVRLKDVPDRSVCLRKIDGRWFMQNRYKPETEKK